MAVPRRQTTALGRSQLNCSTLQLPRAATAKALDEVLFTCGVDVVPHGGACALGCPSGQGLMLSNSVATGSNSSWSSTGLISVGAACFNGIWKLPKKVRWKHLGCVAARQLADVLTTMAPSSSTTMLVNLEDTPPQPNNFSVAAIHSSRIATGEGIDVGAVFAVVLVILVIPAIAVAVVVHRMEQEKLHNESEQKYDVSDEESYGGWSAVRQQSLGQVRLDRVENLNQKSSEKPPAPSVKPPRSVLDGSDTRPSPPPAGELPPSQPLVNSSLPDKSQLSQEMAIPGQILDDEEQSVGGSSQAPSMPPAPKDEVEV